MPLWAGYVFALLFVLHSANYLYFFVDDEAIPYVFAQNLLDGKGLRYNSFEGPVEGYSDFLQVLVATSILEIVRLLQLDKVHVFTINKAWSLACGVGVVWLTFRMLRRLPGVGAPGLVAGMMFVVLAGPLAVWSCSSLETATFTFLISCLVAWVIAPPTDARPGWIIAGCTAAALLARIDGLVHVGAVIGSTMLVCGSRGRRDLFAAVVLPSLAVFTVYQLWRIWYFPDLLPPPVMTKVLYKLRPHAHLLVHLLRALLSARRGDARSRAPGRAHGIQPGRVRAIHARFGQHRQSRALLTVFRETADDGPAHDGGRAVRAADEQTGAARGRSLPPVS